MYKYECLLKERKTLSKENFIKTNLKKVENYGREKKKGHCILASKMLLTHNNSEL